MTAHRWLFAGAASVPLERTRLKPPQDPTSSRWRHPRRCPPSPRQPPARCSRSARCPTTGAPARSPSRAASRRAKPLTHRVLSHRRDITPAQAPRDGSAHSCGSTRTYGATPPRLGAAHGSNRCRPTTRLLPLPLSAMRPLRQCTPRTRRQIPLRLATVAAMRPPPALIVTTRLLRYTFLPCAGERTAAAIDGGAAGRVRE